MVTVIYNKSLARDHQSLNLSSFERNVLITDNEVFLFSWLKFLQRTEAEMAQTI